MTSAVRKAAEGLSYTVPKKNQGQMIEVAYACDLDNVFMRRTNRSDGLVSYFFADWTPGLMLWWASIGPDSSEPDINEEDWFEIEEGSANV